MSYYMSKTVGLSFDEAVEKVTEELKKEGFGILTEIDVQRTLKRKLNVDFRKYQDPRSLQSSSCLRGIAHGR